MKAPFPYFGAKRSVAHIIWERFGSVMNYVEPFVGSAAVLLARPEPIEGTESIGDLDGHIVNVWRALKQDMETVASEADEHPGLRQGTTFLEAVENMKQMVEEFRLNPPRLPTDPNAPLLYFKRG